MCAEVEVISGQKAYWFKMDENGELAGGIAKFLQEKKDAVIEALGLKNGDFVALSAGTLGAAQKTAGVIRKLVGTSFDGYMKKECYEFCWVVDFPMYEIGEESGELEFCHNPFSMPQGGVEALENQDPLEILAYQYDLVCNGIELSSGAVRNHDPEDHGKSVRAGWTGRRRCESEIPCYVQCILLRRTAARRDCSRRRPYGYADCR